MGVDRRGFLASLLALLLPWKPRPAAASGWIHRDYYFSNTILLIQKQEWSAGDQIVFDRIVTPRFTEDIAYPPLPW